MYGFVQYERKTDPFFIKVSNLCLQSSLHLCALVTAPLAFHPAYLSPPDVHGKVTALLGDNRVLAPGQKVHGASELASPVIWENFLRELMWMMFCISLKALPGFEEDVKKFPEWKEWEPVVEASMKPHERGQTQPGWISFNSVRNVFSRLISMLKLLLLSTLFKFFDPRIPFSLISSFRISPCHVSSVITHPCVFLITFYSTIKAFF